MIFFYEKTEACIACKFKDSVETINDKRCKTHLDCPFKNDISGHIDNVGGIHEDGLGWNPNGVACGECSEISCENCSIKDRKNNSWEH